MALITDKDIADIKAALVELAPYTEEPVVYKQYDHMDDGDPVMGTPDTPVYISDDKTAMIRNLTVEEVSNSVGVYLFGDMEFSVRMDDEPKFKDLIHYQGANWNPKTINKVFLGEVLWWEIRARRE